LSGSLSKLEERGVGRGAAMPLTDILSVQRIVVDRLGEQLRDREQVLAALGRMLSDGTPFSAEQVEAQLLERERLQSTGIGDGVAIPHTSLELASGQRAALALCPQGVGFDSIDGQPVYIVFGVVGPKRATSEHLKILAKVSRLLKSPETRRRLLEAPDAEQAYALIEEHERAATTAS
jgi:PTS system nitrogen regulatory IIA component